MRLFIAGEGGEERLEVDGRCTTVARLAALAGDAVGEPACAPAQVLVRRAVAGSSGLAGAPARLDALHASFALDAAGIADGDTLVVLPKKRGGVVRESRDAATPARAEAGWAGARDRLLNVAAVATSRQPRSARPPGPREIRAACESECAARGLPAPAPLRAPLAQRSPLAMRQHLLEERQARAALESLLRLHASMSGAEGGREEHPQEDEEEAQQEEEAPLPQANADLVANMVSMGFNENASHRALLTHRDNLERAIEWLCEHTGDTALEQPITDDERREIADRRSGGRRRNVGRGEGGGGGPRIGAFGVPPPVADEADPATVNNLADMGFARDSASNALRATDNDPEAAVELILHHGGVFSEHNLRTLIQRREQRLRAQAGRAARAQQRSQVSESDLRRHLMDAVGLLNSNNLLGASDGGSGGSDRANDAQRSAEILASLQRLANPGAAATEAAVASGGAVGDTSGDERDADVRSGDDGHGNRTAEGDGPTAPGAGGSGDAAQQPAHGDGVNLTAQLEQIIPAFLLSDPSSLNNENSFELMHGIMERLRAHTQPWRDDEDDASAGSHTDEDDPDTGGDYSESDESYSASMGEYDLAPDDFEAGLGNVNDGSEELAFQASAMIGASELPDDIDEDQMDSPERQGSDRVGRDDLDIDPDEMD